MFRIWLPQQKELMDHLDDLEGQVLGCWCDEDAECHGDVYLDLLQARKKGALMNRPNYRIDQTEHGWQFHAGETSTMLPFSFNPKNDIDPIAIHHLAELYDGDHIDAEFLAFKQKGAAVFTPTHQIAITSAGVYLMRVRIFATIDLPVQNEADFTVHTVKKDQVQFVRVKYLDEIYKGEREAPYILVEHAIAVESDREAALITEAFQKTNEINL